MESSAVGTDKQSQTTEMWQLQMFSRSLKKQQKVRALLDVAGNTEGKKCLLLTCGDNNGAINWHIKQHGGEWSWADAEHDSIAQIREVTGNDVAEMNKDNPALPFVAESFDLIMTIDVHEHIKEPESLNRELARLVKTRGRVIVTTPNGDEKKLATRIKKIVGMRPEDYGHYVVGYDVPQLDQQMEDVGLTPFQEASYSRFFTEMLELAINFAYVKLLSKRSEARVEKGQIAPQNINQVKSVEKTYKLYAVIYPLFLAISKLDFMDRSPRGYAVIVAARKE
jgi:2-polyprenyl-3-methyl-5-hydroxy-6-metoxy-1,4-benzoquinol methylase